MLLTSTLETFARFLRLQDVLRRNRRAEPPERDGKILSNHRKNSDVAVGNVVGLARWGPSAVHEIEITNK